MNLDSKPSNSNPPNNGQVIYSYYGMETTEQLLEDYYKANIDQNHPNFHIIWEIVKEERKTLSASIDLFKKSKLPYLSIN